jgi:nucleotide-binding universal stress UspA family protein
MEEAMGTIKNGTDPKSVVLVGVDLSPPSREILQAAVDIAARSPSELHIVHVMPIASADMLGVSRADRELGYARQIELAREELDRLAMTVHESVKHVAGHLRVGSPDVEIAQLATDIGADCIVVGTHGRRGWDRLLLGSVAESLVRHAPCPVLTWRPKAIPIWNQIAPPCPDCAAVQKKTNRAKLWCDRHSQHHERAHTYYEVPPSYGIGAQTFR